MRLRVIIESPLRASASGTMAQHEHYARAALKDSLLRGEAPLASHLLYPQVFDDLDPIERAAGMRAGIAWMLQAQLIAVYENLGLSAGMIAAIALAEALEIPVEHRSIAGYALPPTGAV